MGTKNLNVNIDEEVIEKAKAKAAILCIDLKDFVERVLEDNTKNIALEKMKTKIERRNR